MLLYRHKSAFSYTVSFHSMCSIIYCNISRCIHNTSTSLHSLYLTVFMFYINVDMMWGVCVLRGQYQYWLDVLDDSFTIISTNTTGFPNLLYIVCRVGCCTRWLLLRHRVPSSPVHPYLDRGAWYVIVSPSQCSLVPSTLW